MNICTQGTSVWTELTLLLLPVMFPTSHYCTFLIHTDNTTLSSISLCEIWSLLLISPQPCNTQNRQAFPSSSVSLVFLFFAGELKLIVSNVAIQLWSRAVLQGCHDRINENNIRESHFIHMLLGKGQRPYFKGKCQHSRASQQQMVWKWSPS